jgi:DNA ligase (NAD+)
MEEKIQKLIDKLNYYTKLYDEGRPEISDQEWDDMYFELQKLENETGIYYGDSPTQNVNFQVVNQLNKVTHNHPMLSLDKTKDKDVIKSFIGNKTHLAMAKMDGLTCSLRYLNGKLVSAETRGNGIVGEDILHNALQVKNIPHKINFKDELIIDGEIICTYNDFKDFEAEYKNPRNFASGSIRLLDSKESAMRKLTFVA